MVCGRRRAGLREGRRGRVLLLLTKGLPGSGRGHGCGGVVRWVEAGPRLRGAPEARGVAEATEGGGGKGGERPFPPQRLCEGGLLSGAA